MIRRNLLFVVDRFEESMRRNAEGLRQPPERADARIALASFQIGQIGALHVAIERERLLGQSPRLAQLSDVLREQIDGVHAVI